MDGAGDGGGGGAWCCFFALSLVGRNAASDGDDGDAGDVLAEDGFDGGGADGVEKSVSGTGSTQMRSRRRLCCAVRRA